VHAKPKYNNNQKIQFLQKTAPQLMVEQKCLLVHC